MALQGKITTNPGLRAKSAAQRTIEAQKITTYIGTSFSYIDRCRCKPETRWFSDPMG